MKTFLTAITALLNRALSAIHITGTAAEIADHVVIVFVTTFVAQVVGAWSGAFNWPTISALVVSAAAAGASAVWHYLVGLIPSEAKA